MIPLPIDSSLPEITTILNTHNALILIAPPGAGKTTRIPPALLATNLLPKTHPNLIMLQPRRVAARAAAQRIAEENHWTLGGNEVGYHIRFEKRYTPKTRIRILTEAILTRILLDDPYLDTIGAVILDEFHERNLHTDLALAFLREIQQTVRPDLKLLIMSATLDPTPISQFLNQAPVITTQGRTFPITTAHDSPRDRPLESHIADVLETALQHEGDILIFLPGRAEIDRTRRKLAPLERDNIAILPLHGSLTPEEQQRALNPDPQRRQRIILATNIAETSLTIDGVRTVIDSGLARIASFDPDRGMDRLDLTRISKASADQRAGRAGRQAPGQAWRLWPQLEHKHLPDFNTPEIHRVDLASTLLSVHAWGAKDPRVFPFFEPPPEPILEAAEQLLTHLDALRDGSLTPMGRQMLKLPTHPRIARLLLAATGTPLLEDALTLAAILSDDSRTSTTGADALIGLHMPPHLKPIRDQLATITRSIDTRRSAIGNPQSLTDLLLLAYPDRVAKRRGKDPHAAIMADGSGLRLAKEALTPAIVNAPLFLALDAHHDPRNKKAEALVRSAIPLDESTLQRLLPEDLRTQTALTYDPDQQKVRSITRHQFHNLILHEDPHGKVDPQAAGQILAQALMPRAHELFTADPPSARLLARLALLRHQVPEHPWPPLNDPQLRDLLTLACASKRSLAELTSPILCAALMSALPYPLDRQLDQLAPETLSVPTGSRIKLEYTLPTGDTPPPPPILAVRLQELFGLLDTPRIASGRIPVLLHLLSPGYKPMQITSDLRSFWSSAYFEIRKDLRARYPKHKWPENPLEATPEAKGRRKH